jgi:hypothetical protein
MTPVEAMARAMCKSADENWDAVDFNQTAAGNDPEDVREFYRAQALAALRALRENVSEGMVDAARCVGHREWDNRMAITAALRAAEEERT